MTTLTIDSLNVDHFLSKDWQALPTDTILVLGLVTEPTDDLVKRAQELLPYFDSYGELPEPVLVDYAVANAMRLLEMPTLYRFVNGKVKEMIVHPKGDPNVWYKGR